MRNKLSVSRPAHAAALLLLLLVVCPAREAAAQGLSMISVNGSGTAAGNGVSYNPSLSADGRYAAYHSSASDIVANDNNGTDDVYVRDLQTGAVTLVSVNRFGTATGNRGSVSPRISADGRFVVFTSAASDLTATPISPSAIFAVQVYVRDLVQQKTTLVSVNAAGTHTGNHNSISPVISPDGRFVAFVSVATDLVALSDPNGTTDVYLRDTQTGTTELMSVNAAGTGAGNRDSSFSANGGVQEPLLSADGRFVVFESVATDLTALPDTNQTSDVFIRDAVTDTTSLVSVNQTGDAAANGTSDLPAMSADGRLVTFRSQSNNLIPETAGVGVWDVFVRDTQAKTTRLVSVNLAGGPGGGGPSRITPDGRYVVFSSGSTNMVSGVRDTASLDVFRRDLHTNTTELVTFNKWGTRAGDDDSWNAVVSDDGRFVAFQSEAASLVEEADFSFSNDIFLRDMAAGTTRLLSVSKDGGASAPGGSVFPVISGDGRRIAFGSYSTTLLALGDANNGSDLFAYAAPQELPEPSFVQLAAAEVTAPEAGGPVTFTVTRTGDTSAPATVEYATSDGTASERTDYAAALGTLVFAAGETTKTVTVLVNDDPFVEPEETFTLRLSAPYRVRLGAIVAATARLSSDDATPPAGALNYSDDSAFFVRQHYRDFLGREPDAEGLAHWTNEIESCAADAQCREVKRINVSAAFFQSIEFRETGYFVYRVRMVASGALRGPSNPVPLTLREFLHDTQEVARGVVVGEPGWQQRLEANKQAYLEEFVRREAFADVFPVGMNNQAFVYELYDGSNRQLPQVVLSDLLNRSSQMTRAQLLRAVAEDPTLTRNESNRAFVLMQYFGYLRRNPSDAPEPGLNFAGFNFWLGKLNEFNGNFIAAEMVKAFITSAEYRRRFGN
ncbi:MAG: Calx-beta domain-containing protein [Pyrinomonadaceae bacterium]